MQEKNAINKKFNDIINMGYKNDEVIDLTLGYATLYSYSIQRIKKAYNNLKKLGYSDSEIISMTLNFPTLYGYKCGSVKEKIEYLRKIKLDFIILEKTKYLMVSLDLLHARYEFFTKEKGYIIDRNFYTTLFQLNKQFNDSYHITKEQLIKKYPRGGK